MASVGGLAFRHRPDYKANALGPNLQENVATLVEWVALSCVAQLVFGVGGLPAVVAVVVEEEEIVAAELVVVAHADAAPGH